MSLKLKVLGLSLLAFVAMSAVAVINASARTNGHFTSDSPTGKTTILGAEVPGTPHQTEFTVHGLEGGVVCDDVAYHGTMSSNTSTHITIVPFYKKCHTTGSAADTTVIDVNGCSYTFTPGDNGTVHVDCPTGKSIEITHPNCTIKIKPQTAQGVTYLTDLQNGRHIITPVFHKVQFSSEYEAGICIFTGTNHTATLHGSATIRGFDDTNPLNQQSITYTS